MLINYKIYSSVFDVHKLAISIDPLREYWDFMPYKVIFMAETQTMKTVYP